MLTLNKIYSTLFLLGVFFIPFNEFEGLSFLGEYKNEAATYFFLSAFVLIVCENILEKKLYFPYKNWLIVILGTFILWTIISSAINIETILVSYYKQTSGLSRYIRQTISLLISAVIFTYVFWNVIRNYTLEEIIRKIRKVFLWSLVFVFVYGCIEILIVFFGKSYLLPVLKLFDYFPFVTTEINVYRVGISSVTYEIPSLGNYLITIAGFMFSYMITSKKITRFLPTLMVMILMIFSDSRTALVLITVQLLLFFFILLHHNEYRENIKAFSKFSAIFIVLFLIINSNKTFTKVEERLDRLNFSKNLTTDVSNKSRFGMQIASIQVFKDNPIVGVGLGQDTYHKIKYYPYWATQKNYEFPYYYKNQRDPSFPTAYNLYTRLLSELGIIGVFILLVFIVLCMYWSVYLWKYSINTEKFIPIILIVSFVGLAINWMQTDFFRQYGFWLCLMLLIKAQDEITKIKSLQE